MRSDSSGAIPPYAEIALTVWFGFCIVVGGRAQTVMISPEQFNRATQTEKRQALRELASSDALLSSDQLKAMLIAGMADSNARVRESALRALMARIGNPKPAQLEVWLQHERPIVMSLRPAVLHLLDDPDVDVRLAAIETSSSLELDFTVPGHAMRTLQPDVARMLVDRHAVEPNGLARSRIVNVFAWFTAHPNIERERTALIARALSDPAPAVLQAAVLAVGMQHLTALLPRAVELLAHHEAGIRNAVAQAISEFGGDAAPYVPNLHEALVRESNVMTRQSLEGAIKRITP